MKVRLKLLEEYFKRMSLREQFLALLFVLVILSIWSGNCFKRYSQWIDAKKETSSILQTQQLWLDQADTSSAEAAQAKEQLDTARTYTATQLSGQIDKLLRQCQLSNLADIDTVRSKEGEIFTEHTIRVRLKRINIKQLIELNKLLRQQTPYINQQSMRITANRSKPEELDVRYEISSLELIVSAP
ncbi:MAG: hypothetical protein VXZ08_00845 [Verrucomicrobiota bacterium]|nr:hypothetical protein [Verrucomicrobiota bacterium]